MISTPEQLAARNKAHDTLCDMIQDLGLPHVVDLLSTVAYEVAEKIRKETQGGSQGINDSVWRGISVSLGNTASSTEMLLTHAIEANEGAKYRNPLNFQLTPPPTDEMPF